MIYSLALAVVVAGQGHQVQVNQGHSTCISPDHLLVAQVTVGEGEALELTIKKKNHTILFLSNVCGFAWLPTQPSQLVWGQSGIYGEGRVGFWIQKTGIHELVKGKTPESAVFKLLGIAPKAKGYLIHIKGGNSQSIEALYKHFNILLSESRIKRIRAMHSKK